MTTFYVKDLISTDFYQIDAESKSEAKALVSEYTDIKIGALVAYTEANPFSKPIMIG